MKKTLILSAVAATAIAFSALSAYAKDVKTGICQKLSKRCPRSQITGEIK